MAAFYKTLRWPRFKRARRRAAARRISMCPVPGEAVTGRRRDRSRIVPTIARSPRSGCQGDPGCAFSGRTEGGQVDKGRFLAREVGGPRSSRATGHSGGLNRTSDWADMQARRRGKSTTLPDGCRSWWLEKHAVHLRRGRERSGARQRRLGLRSGKFLSRTVLGGASRHARTEGGWRSCWALGRWFSPCRLKSRALEAV